MTALHQSSVAAVVALTLVVSACSTPPVKYFNGPPEAKASRSSLAAAIEYLDAARNQYQTAVEAQMRDERHVSNALIGGGALMAALALGAANRNFIGGSALLLGTGYALGNHNLQRQRVLVYLAGVDALTCAEKAVAPMGVASESFASLGQALKALEASRNELTTAMANGRVAMKSAAPGSRDGSELTEALGIATQVLQASETTLKSGREFVETSAQAGRELVAAVNGIDKAVVASLVNGTPELSAVPGLVAGLAGMSAQFAPGAGVDTLITGKLSTALGVATTKSQVEAARPLLQAAVAVLAASEATRARDAEAKALMPQRAVTWPDGAFKACGVAEVASALTSVDALRFAPGVDDRQTFEIYGGIKPYFAKFDGPAVDGLTVTSPVRFDNQGVVTVAGSKVKSALEGRIRIVDSSPGAPRSTYVVLTVAAAKSPPSNPAPEKPAAKKVTDVGTGSPSDVALSKLKKMGQFKIGTKNYVGIGVPVRNGAAIEMTLGCPDAVQHKRADLAKAVLEVAGVAGEPPTELRLKTIPATCAVD